MQHLRLMKSSLAVGLSPYKIAKKDVLASKMGRSDPETVGRKRTITG